MSKCCVKNRLKRSFRLLLIHCAAALVAFAFVTLFFSFVKPVLPCVFYRVTGYPCPACGGTRAAYALLHGRILLSLTYNPIPVLGTALFLSVIGFEAACAAGGKEKRYSVNFFSFAVVAIMAVAVIYDILRCCGYAPLPGDVAALFN